MYTAIELSKYIVTKCVNDSCPISNLQLQKILYYIQREYLKRGTPAFMDRIEAWQFGPVVPNVYYMFCGYGAMPITSSFDVDLENAENIEVIDRIIEEKRELDPWDLVADTHQQGGAWDKVYNSGKGDHEVIPCELIQQEG